MLFYFKPPSHRSLLRSPKLLHSIWRAVCLIANLAEAAPAENHPCNATARSLWDFDPKESLEDLFLPKMCDRTGPENHSRTESGVEKIKNKPSVEESAFSWVGACGRSDFQWELQPAELWGPLAPAAPKSLAALTTTSHSLYVALLDINIRANKHQERYRESAAAQHPAERLCLKVDVGFNELLLLTRLYFPREAESSISLVKGILGNLI